MAGAKPPEELEDFQIVEEPEEFEVVEVPEDVEVVELAEEEDISSLQDAISSDGALGWMLSQKAKPKQIGENLYEAGSRLAVGEPVEAAKALVGQQQTPEQYEEEFEKEIEEGPEFSKPKDMLSNVAVGTLESVFDFFSGIDAVTLGPLNRLASSLDEGMEKGSVSGAWNGLLNPSYIQEMRIRNGLPADFSAAYDRAKDSGQLTSFLLQEVFPLKAEPADMGYAKKKIEETVAAVDDPDLKNIVRATARFAWNVGGSPSAYVTMGSLPILKGAKSAASNAANVEKSMDLAIDAVKSSIRFGQPKTMEQLAKERGLLRVKLPFIKKEYPVWDGEEVARVMDEVSSIVEASTPIRKFSQRTGLETADSLDNLREILIGSASTRLNAVQEFFKNTPFTKDHDVMQYASDIAEHGDKWGAKVFAKRTGKQLSEEQMNQAKQFVPIARKMYDDAIGFWEKTTNRKFPRFDETKGLHRLDDGTEYVIRDGDEIYNFKYASKYGLGRKLLDEVAEMKKGSKDFQAATDSFGLKTSLGSLKKRSEFSNAAMEDAMRGKFGVEYAFSKNIPQVMFDRISDIYHHAIDTGYVKSVKDAFGVRKDQILETINAAKERVARSRISGLSPKREDLIMSKMKPSDFKVVSDSAFDGMAYVAGGDDLGMLFPRDLYYPKQVADRIDAMFSAPSNHAAAKLVSWYGNIKAKNLLTSPFRLGRQAVDNISRASMAGMPMGSIPREIGISMKNAKLGKLDPISEEMRSIPSLSETLVDLGDFKGPLRVNKTILKNEEIANLPQGYVEAIHNLAKKGKPMLSQWLQNAKKGVEYTVDNPVSKFFRTMGNSADVMTKRAYYRNLRERGYDINEAMEATNSVFMDFTRTSGLLKSARIINPFIGFQFKNLESLMTLAFNSPIAVNVLNPYRGHLRGAIEDAGGWDPITARKLQDEVPALRDGALSFILRGSKDLAEDVSEYRKFANQFYLAGLSQEEQDDFLDKGGVLNARWYDPLQGAADFLDVKRFNENMFSPFTSAGIMAITGYDTFRQKYIEAVGTGYEGREQIIEALKKLNPADYQSAYAVMGATMRTTGKFINELFSNPLDEESRRMLEIKDDEKYAGLLKHNKKLGSFMSQAKFLGLGKMNIMEDTFFFHEMALMNQVKKNEMEAKRLMKNEDYKGADIYWKKVEALYRKIEQNSLIFDDAYNLMDKAGQNLMPEVEVVPLEDETGNVELEAEPFEDLEVFEVDSNDQPVNNRPKSMEELQNRTRELIEKYSPLLNRKPSSEAAPIQGSVSEVVDLGEGVGFKTGASDALSNSFPNPEEDPSGLQYLEIVRKRIDNLSNKKGKLTPAEQDEAQRLLKLRPQLLKKVMDYLKNNYQPMEGEGEAEEPAGPLQPDLQRLYDPTIPEQKPGLETNVLPERIPASQQGDMR
jgi:hypothetical protein